MYQASCLISYRYRDSHRQRNLEFVLRLFEALPGLEIILVEQDSEPRLSASRLPACCRYLFVNNSGPFNKSWGLNIAAQQAQCERLVFMDADMLLSLATLEEMLARLHSDADAVNPYDTLIDLDEEETGYLLGGNLALDLQRTVNEINRRDMGESPPFCGGVFAVTRHLWERCGGLDERFTGWGGEDDAISMRVAQFAENAVTLCGQPAYHLWHPPAMDQEKMASLYLPNCARLAFYSEQSEDFFKVLAEADKRSNGATDKYRDLASENSEPAETPLVSCLCVTRQRPDLLARAVRCFENQTYLHRELVIVCEDDDPETQVFVGQLDSARIVVHIIPANPKLSLGGLRNLSIERANGEYICQWDDDDWYHPQRISRQLDSLKGSDQGASVLPRWLIYSTRDRIARCSNLRLWEGSLLCRKDLLLQGNSYLNTSAGEDSDLIARLYVKDDIKIYDQPDLYVYIHTGRNTWNPAHFESILASSTPLDEADSARLRRLIGEEGEVR